MANYQQLKNALVDVIKQNGNNEITGEIMQTTLLSMINSLGANYQFAGILTPSVSFIAPDENVFFIGGGGTYNNFGASQIVVPNGCIGIFMYNGTYSYQVIQSDSVFDISEYHATGGTPAQYADLTAALDGGDNVPDGIRKGGMSVKFIQSSDNNYVQFRCKSQSFSINIDDWVCVEKEIESINEFFIKDELANYLVRIENHYVSTYGAPVSFNGCEYRIYDVSEERTVKIHCRNSSVSGIAIWATYSALNNGDIDSYFKVRTFEGTVTTQHHEYNLELELQANEKYIVVCNMTNTWDLNDGVYVKSINYTPSLESIVKSINQNSEDIEDIREDIEDIREDIEDIEQSQLNVVAMGDSITWLGGVNCDDADGWTKWFKDKLKPKSIKSYAWSGATWTNTSNTVATDVELNSLNDNNTIWQQIRRLIADVTNEVQVTPDVVIIAAGVNDVIAKHYAAVGESSPSDHRPNLLDKTAAQAFSDQSAYITSASVQTIVTLADSVRYGCEMLIQAFPSVQIILMTPLQTSLLTFATTYGDNQATLDSVRQIIKDCAAYLSANVIEQNKVCGVYYTQEKVGHYNLYDGLHTSETGAKKIGSIVSSIVKAMVV